MCTALCPWHPAISYLIQRWQAQSLSHRTPSSRLDIAPPQTLGTQGLERRPRHHGRLLEGQGMAHPAFLPVLPAQWLTLLAQGSKWQSGVAGATAGLVSRYLHSRRNAHTSPRANTFPPIDSSSRRSTSSRSASSYNPTHSPTRYPSRSSRPAPPSTRASSRPRGTSSAVRA